MVGVATALQLLWAPSLNRKVHGSKIVIRSSQKMPVRKSHAAAAGQQRLLHCTACFHLFGIEPETGISDMH